MGGWVYVICMMYDVWREDGRRGEEQRGRSRVKNVSMYLLKSAIQASGIVWSGMYVCMCVCVC